MSGTYKARFFLLYFLNIRHKSVVGRDAPPPPVYRDTRHSIGWSMDVSVYRTSWDPRLRAICISNPTSIGRKVTNIIHYIVQLVRDIIMAVLLYTYMINIIIYKRTCPFNGIRVPVLGRRRRRLRRM